MAGERVTLSSVLGRIDQNNSGNVNTSNMDDDTTKKFDKLRQELLRDVTKFAKSSLARASGPSINLSSIMGSKPRESFILRWKWNRLRSKIITKVSKGLPDKFDFGENGEIKLSSIMGSSPQEGFFLRRKWNKLRKKIIAKVDEGLPTKFRYLQKDGTKISSLLGVSPQDDFFLRRKWNRLRKKIIDKVDEGLPTKFKYLQKDGSSISSILGSGPKDNFILKWRWNNLRHEIINRVEDGLPENFNVGDSVDFSTILGSTPQDDFFLRFRWNRLRSKILKRIENGLPDEIRLDNGDLLGNLGLPRRRQQNTDGDTQNTDGDTQNTDGASQNTGDTQNTDGGSQNTEELINSSSSIITFDTNSTLFEPITEKLDELIECLCGNKLQDEENRRENNKLLSDIRDSLRRGRLGGGDGRNRNGGDGGGVGGVGGFGLSPLDLLYGFDMFRRRGNRPPRGPRGPGRFGRVLSSLRNFGGRGRIGTLIRGGSLLGGGFGLSRLFGSGAGAAGAGAAGAGAAGAGAAGAGAASKIGLAGAAKGLAYVFAAIDGIKGIGETMKSDGSTFAKLATVAPNFVGDFSASFIGGFADLGKDITSWTAGKLGFENFKNKLDSFSIQEMASDGIRMLTDTLIKNPIDYIGDVISGETNFAEDVKKETSLWINTAKSSVMSFLTGGEYENNNLMTDKSKSFQDLKDSRKEISDIDSSIQKLESKDKLSNREKANLSKLKSQREQLKSSYDSNLDSYIATTQNKDVPKEVWDKYFSGEMTFQEFQSEAAKSRTQTIAPSQTPVEIPTETPSLSAPTETLAPSETITSYPQLKPTYDIEGQQTGWSVQQIEQTQPETSAPTETPSDFDETPALSAPIIRGPRDNLSDEEKSWIDNVEKNFFEGMTIADMLRGINKNLKEGRKTNYWNRDGGKYTMAAADKLNTTFFDDAPMSLRRNVEARRVYREKVKKFYWLKSYDEYPNESIEAPKIPVEPPAAPVPTETIAPSETPSDFVETPAPVEPPAAPVPTETIAPSETPSDFVETPAPVEPPAAPVPVESSVPVEEVSESESLENMYPREDMSLEELSKEFEERTNAGETLRNYSSSESNPIYQHLKKKNPNAKLSDLKKKARLISKLNSMDKQSANDREAEEFMRGKLSDFYSQRESGNPSNVDVMMDNNAIYPNPSKSSLGEMVEVASMNARAVSQSNPNVISSQQTSNNNTANNTVVSNVQKQMDDRTTSILQPRY